MLSLNECTHDRSFPKRSPVSEGHCCLAFILSNPSFLWMLLYHEFYLKACVICVGSSCFAKKKKRSLTDLLVTQPQSPMRWARTNCALLGREMVWGKLEVDVTLSWLSALVAFSSCSVSAFLCLLLIQRTFLETAFRHEERDANWSCRCSPSQPTGLLWCGQEADHSALSFKRNKHMKQVY